MARTATDTLEMGGQDSFVDVVTNLVGVLIILVVIIGLRSKPAPAGIALPSELVDELEQLQQESGAVESEMQGLTSRIQSVRLELAARSLERQKLSYAVAVTENELATKRQQLSADEVRQLDLARELAAAQQELDDQNALLERAASTKPLAVEIKSYPTPLSKTVFGKELHFQLSGGRIAYIP